MDFDINLELHDFLQFPDVDVVTHVESEEETANLSLGVNHLCVDRFYDYGKHGRMLEAEVLKFNFSLGCKRSELDRIIK